MKKLILLLFTLALPGITALSQTPAAAEAPAQPAQEPIHWLTVEEALAQHQVTPKKWFVDVYTDWCGWCKKMEATTFHDPVIAQVINQYYYPVRFNAEYKNDITFNGQTFHFIPQGSRGYHELAAAMLQGKMSYPTVVFMDEQLSLLQPIPGFRQPAELEPILTFYGADFYKTTTWEDFTARHQSPLR